MNFILYFLRMKKKTNDFSNFYLKKYKYSMLTSVFYLFH